MAATPTIDQAKLDAFMGQFVKDLGAAATAPLVVHRRQARALQGDGRRRPVDAGASSPSGPAAASATSASGSASRPRRATSNTTGGAFRLPPEQAIALADEDSPAFIPGGVPARRRDGQGRAARPRALPHRRGHAAGTSTTTTCSRAPSASSAPAISRTWSRLAAGAGRRRREARAGAKVADIGCGHGASTIIMAQAFPASTFIGFDYHDGVDRGGARGGRARRRRRPRRRSRSPGAQGASAAGRSTSSASSTALHDMGDPVGAAASRPLALSRGRHVDDGRAAAPATRSRTT